MKSLDLHLRWVLFNADSTRRNALVFILALRRAYERSLNHPKTTMLYGDPPEEKPKKSSEFISIGKLMRGEKKASLTDMKTCIDTIEAKILEALEKKSPLINAWVMIIIMYVSHYFRKLICENTEQKIAEHYFSHFDGNTQHKLNIADAYFKNFDDRFIIALCGHVVPKKSRKPAPDSVLKDQKVMRASEPPILIVFDEQNLFLMLQRMR